MHTFLILYYIPLRSDLAIMGFHFHFDHLTYPLASSLPTSMVKRMVQLFI